MSEERFYLTFRLRAVFYYYSVQQPGTPAAWDDQPGLLQGKHAV
jgi:hypothetical protein